MSRSMLFCVCCFATILLAFGQTRYDGQQIWKVKAGSFDELTDLKLILQDPKVSVSSYVFLNPRRHRTKPIGLSAKVERHRLSSRGGTGTAYLRVAADDASYVTTVLDAARLEFDVEVRDVQRQLDIEREDNEKRRKKRATASLDDFDYSHYHPLNEIEKWMDLLAEKYDFVSRITIGRSMEGRLLTGLHVAKASSGNKPVFYMDGATHAREWISASTVLFICNQIIQNDSYSDILNAVDFYFVPVVNLDGYVYSWTRNRLWRKTRRPYMGSNPDPLCFGVDANRNWDVGFGGPGSSGSPCSIVYRGPYAESEHVVFYLANFIKREADKIKAFISFHNWGQQILYPYNRNITLHPPTEAELNATGASMHAAIKSVHGYRYEYGRGAEILYVFAGSTSDWAYEKAGIDLSFTIELRDNGPFYFELPADQIIPTGQEALAAVEALSNIIIQKYGGTEDVF